MENRPKTGKSSDGREMHYSVGIIVECNKKYLLLERVNTPPGFACPAGHIDEGENQEIAALRELEEETGIHKKEIEFICEEEIPWNYCTSNAEAHYWYVYQTSVDLEDVTIQKEEARSFGWYSAEEMKDLRLEEVWHYWFKKLGII